jgi:hypothetical protein
LTIWLGERQRITWNCNAGCDAVAVKKAMLAKGITPSCIPWNPHGKPTGSPRESTIPKSVVEQLIRQRLAIDELRLRLGELVWDDADTATVARELKLSRRTFYNYRCPK